MPRAIIFTLVIVSGTVLGEGKKPFKQEEKVLSVLKSYISCVDEKNIEGMLEHLLKDTRYYSLVNSCVVLANATNQEIFSRIKETKQKKPILYFMSLLGQVSETKKEDLIDDFTAIFGSGPAYIYLFINSLIEIANKSGFKNSDSMVLQTFLGSILLLLSGQKKPSDLQKKVTSKGGTTEAALSILASNKGLKSLLTKAVNKATKRSRELSKIS